MTTVLRALVLSFAVAMTAVCSGLAADQQKIAVVDIESLIKSHPDTKSAESLLQNRQDEFETEQKEMIAELEKLKKEFDKAQKETENKALSDSEKEKKRASLEEKYAEMRDQDRKIRETTNQRQKDLIDQKTRMRRRIFTKIRDIVKEYAEKNGYVMVLDSSAISLAGVEAVVYVTDKNDITAAVRKIVEEQKADASDKAEKKSSEK